MATPPADGNVDLRAAKQALRKQILAARAVVPPEERARRSELISTRLLASPEIAAARCVLAYLSFGHELSTRGLVAQLLRRNIGLALPRIDKQAHRLELYRVSDLERDTVAGVWGIQEPDPGRCANVGIEEIDAIVVPGVAFTRAGDRLGYGGGYYDELLSRWQRSPPRLAAAFDLQIVEHVPTGPQDQRVDAVITESRQYRA
jgi:5-formyltetrahydrofolate cyclo-ligase